MQGYCSLSTLLSFSSLSSHESACDSAYCSAGFTVVAFQPSQSVFLFELGVETPAVNALDIVIDVFTDQPEVMLSLIASNQNHLILWTQVTGATKLTEEVVKNMLMISIQSYHLSVEVDPSWLGSTSLTLWFNKLEGTSLSYAFSTCLVNDICDSIKKEFVLISFVTFNRVEVDSILFFYVCLCFLLNLEVFISL